MLDRTGDVHQYATRSARTGIALTARDHRLVGYRVPKEWATLTEGQRGVGSLLAFKKGSRGVSWRSMGHLSALSRGVGCVCLGADLTLWAPLCGDGGMDAFWA